MRVFDRLIGLETEYAICFRPDSRWSDRPSNHDLFEALIPHVQRRIPLVRARHFKKGYFLATGGAVWFEKVRQGVRAGFIEGTTPECRGPRQLLAYQRAQDELLASAAQDVSAGGPLVLLKNDRDPRGHVYGAQENYEVLLPPGGALQAWRWGVACTLALVPLVWLLILALVLLVGASDTASKHSSSTAFTTAARGGAYSRAGSGCRSAWAIRIFVRRPNTSESGPRSWCLMRSPAAF